VGPPFDWYGNGDVDATLGEPDRVFHVAEPTAGSLREPPDVSWPW